MKVAHRAYQVLLSVSILALATALAQAQTYTVLHNFVNTDGCCSIYPSVMAQGFDGNIYGATTSGGQYGYGAIFVITPAGGLTLLHSFNFTDGDGPQGGITMGLDGNFYGTTYQGGGANGAISAGTIFKITPGGVFTHLYSFTNSTDGAYPRTPPVMAPDGNLYGCTGNGTQYALYRITTAGVFTVMTTLPNQTYSPLLVGTDGNLYGTTLYGGTYNEGTLFKFVPSSKALTILHSFNTERGVSGPLIQGSDGAIYGTASIGGTGSSGAIYRITTGGTYKVIYNFTTAGTSDGRIPQNGGVQGSDGFLYGIASTGGALGLGTLFKVSTAGTGFTLLHSFQTATGDTPSSALLLHTNGTIYGQAEHGGTHTAYGAMYSFTTTMKPFVRPLVLVSAKVGGTVHLLGQGFPTATAVDFGSTAATFTISNATHIVAKPVAGSTTAQITVKEPSGNLLSLLKFKIAPTITSFSPTAGPVGSTVTITGMSLSQATAVKFGAVAATAFTINSNTQITVTVPTGAVSNKISVTTPGGGASTATAFTVQ